MKRFDLTIKYDGFNGIKRIMSDGNDLYECLENMISEIEDFRNEYDNNNIKNGGYTAFTDDAKKLYDECESIIDEIEDLIEK